jgi:hypothetical protein
MYFFIVRIPHVSCVLHAPPVYLSILSPNVWREVHVMKLLFM